MLPDRVSNPGPLTYESGALPIALRGPARWSGRQNIRLVGGGGGGTAGNHRSKAGKVRKKDRS